jgi:hypothetical protein
MTVRGEAFDAGAQRGPREILLLTLEIRRMVDFLEERKRLEAELRSKLEMQTHARQKLQQQARYLSEVSLLALKELEQLTLSIQQVPAAQVAESAALMAPLLREMKALIPADGEHAVLHELECDSVQMVKRAIAQFHEKHQTNMLASIDGSAVLPRFYGDEARLVHMLTQLLDSEYLGLATGQNIRITSAIRTGEWWLTLAYHVQEIPKLTHIRQLVGIILTRMMMAWHQGTVDVKTTPDGTRSVTLRFPAERLI